MIAKIAINIPLYKTFDYQIPTSISHTQLKPGLRVKVSFAHRDVVGIFLRWEKQSHLPKNKLKPIQAILDDGPALTLNVLKLCRFAANYYHYPIGEVLFHALPTKLRQLKQIRNKTFSFKNNIKPKPKKFKLNKQQLAAVKSISQDFNRFKCFLLAGVTGSGKTEVYLESIHQLLKMNRQVLVLVPEISLTPQTMQRFQERFSVPVACLHSGLNQTERHQIWLQTKSGEIKILIGTRSALFTPFNNLGMIIVDEEHDTSFKQQEGFRYSARDLAIIRANLEKIPIVLGSATPSLESLYNVSKNRFEILHLPERAGKAIHPGYQIIDVRQEMLENGLSKKLLDNIQTHLDQNNQVLIFLNRRGFAPVLMCHACGFIATCKRCDAKMTYHQTTSQLHCHHCESRQPVYQHCPQCHGPPLHPIGVGTERLESALKKHFKNIPIIRMDRDSTRHKNAMQKLLIQVQHGHRQILVGTQMIAKGHHFPNVTLAGIINMDAGFFSTDFRAIERTAQLLIQVSGRAGRAEKPGMVMLQTHHPNHPLLTTLIQKGYAEFAKLLLQERQESEFPPYTYLALFRAEAMKKTLPETFLKEIKKLCQHSKDVIILGPIPSPMLKRKAHFRAQLLLQTHKRAALQKMLSDLTVKLEKVASKKRVKWSLDVDPIEMY